MQFIPGHKPEEKKKPMKHRFLSHSSILIWKCYLQRRRRWGLLLLEAAFAFLLFLLSIFTAKPVFLTPVEAEPSRPLGTKDVLASLRTGSIVGFAPDIAPYTTVMEKAAEALKISKVLNAQTEDELNVMLYNLSRGVPVKVPIIWVIWKPKDGNIWSLSIRSTERARYYHEHGEAHGQKDTSNQYLQTGFLAVQMAISQAIVQISSPTPPQYEVKLVAMPVSPLMEEGRVRRVLSGILLCFTLALMPPVLEAQALVVTETVSMFKRALRLRNVDYYSMYVSWVVYGYLTCLPICILASVTLILIFRWIHLVEALLVVLAYVSVLIIIAYMMAMFHTKASIACIWTVLFTLLQSYISELLVHHEYDRKQILTFFWHLILPPMGLMHAFHKFALLQTEQAETETDTSSLVYMVTSWALMNALYFGILMILQRTIGQKRAIGGQVSWSSVIFKKAKNRNMLRKIKVLSSSDLEKLQEVDEFRAKAISFRGVSKTIMKVPVLHNITFDIYRGEFNILYTESIQETMIRTIDDLLTGLTSADSGSVIVLGEKVQPGSGMMTTPQMMGYCHRSETLIDDLSVQEHFTLYSMISLWNYINEERNEYALIRSKLLLKECDLESVKHERVRNLNVYYKAQLCWAIAVFLEPRIIIIPRITEYGVYKGVIEDKIMEYKKYKTIVLFSLMKTKLEYADRVFVFDSKILVFGGTPGYMYFKYGREYRLRLNLKCGKTYQEQKELLERLALAKATLRAHLASLIIFRLPVNPSAGVAELVKDLSDNSDLYGLKSFDISVPDIQEVCTRAVVNFRNIEYAYDIDSGIVSRQALVKFNEPPRWTRRTSWLNMHLRCIFSKFHMFHKSNRIALAVTLMSAVIAGACMGLSMPSVLLHLDPAEKIMNNATLTVENMEMKTTLVLRSDNTSACRSIANGYVLSDTRATKKEIENMEYTALPHTEDLKEYLVLRAIDSPQQYVYMYAYGMDVYTNKNGNVEVEALYSPSHNDVSAQPRSLARVYMALMRHYTGSMDATIKIDDDPLTLDLSWCMTELVDSRPPLILELLLILSIWHITFIPSLEYGLIRHLQKHALNFSPIRYWFTMYFYDLLLYWLLVAIMSFIMIAIMFTNVSTQFMMIDFLIVPITLTVYGIGCVPQAYVFSLGPRMGINVMTFVIFNLVFSETTILAKIFYGDALSYIMSFMTLSPQYNIVYAYMKIKQIFLYNNECYIFKDKHLCSANTFHKCCEKCGVLQECFSRKSYFNQDPGILMELTAMLTTAIFFTVLLLLLEYRIFHQLWRAVTPMIVSEDSWSTPLSPGCERERTNVILKEEDIRHSRGRSKEEIYRNKVSPTFGKCLLAKGITTRYKNKYMVRNVYLNLGRGEAMSVVGHKRHGPSILCETLAGYRVPSSGDVWSMSKYKLQSQPHMYSQQVSITCDQKLMPPWMRPREALGLLAALRGVPQGYIHEEVALHIDALELRSKDDYFISEIPFVDRIRLNFAAAVIAAPPVVILDDCTSYQKFSVRRSMYSILNSLRNRGHTIIMSSSSIESHMPITDRLAIMRDGTFYDVDNVENLIERYSEKGFTVVVHLKNEVDVHSMFAKYFTCVDVNDTTEVLVNVQIKDTGLTWTLLFEKMEALKANNQDVYSYIVTAIPIDDVYNSIMIKGPGVAPAKNIFSWKWFRKILSIKPEIMPKPKAISKLMPLEGKYGITKLKELPWSVIFHR